MAPQAKAVQSPAPLPGCSTLQWLASIWRQAPAWRPPVGTLAPSSGARPGTPPLGARVVAPRCRSQATQKPLGLGLARPHRPTSMTSTPTQVPLMLLLDQLGYPDMDGLTETFDMIGRIWPRPGWPAHQDGGYQTPTCLAVGGQLGVPAPEAHRPSGGRT